MNVNVLIDAVVRQTVVLIANLATASGVRTPLSDLAGEVFLGLVRELQGQGVKHKVIADMFGMALRTYHEKVRRLSESATDRGRTLWEAVLGHVQDKGPVSKGALLRRFARDDEAMVRSVLKDLVDTGLLYQSGRGDVAVYRAADPSDLARIAAANEHDTVEAILWVAVLRHSPASAAELERLVGIAAPRQAEILARLVADGRVRAESRDGVIRYSCENCVIPYEDPIGWEAALLDHYSAMVTAIVTKLAAGSRTARPSDVVGGSTYGFDVWKGHPLEEDVLALLRRVRTMASDLRARVDRYNADHTPEDEIARVSFYVGQFVAERNGDTP